MRREELQKKNDLPAAAGSRPPCTIQQYYATHGHLVMASDSRLPHGLLDRNDWNEDEMCEFRWSIVSDSSMEEILHQNAACGFDNEIDPRFRWFYRVVALD